MENTEEPPETRPRRSFGECILGFDNLEIQTNGKFTAELSSLKNLFITLAPSLIEVSSKQAVVLTGQACQSMLAEARDPSPTESSAASNSFIPAFTAKMTGQLESEVQHTHSRVLDLEKETQTLLENVRDELAEQVLKTMEMMWVKRSNSSENDLRENENLRERVTKGLNNLRNERVNLREVGRSDGKSPQ